MAASEHAIAEFGMLASEHDLLRLECSQFLSWSVYLLPNNITEYSEICGNFIGAIPL